MTKSEAVNKLLTFARSQLGYHESGDNGNKFSSMTGNLYGWQIHNAPWCDIFVDACFIQTFGYEKGSAMLFQFEGCSGAACANSAQYFKNNGAFFSTPEVGDQAFFYYSGGINHTGIVETVSGSTFTCIEGNSSDSVKRNTYSLGNSVVAGFGRPRWKYVEADIGEDPEASDPDTAEQEAETSDCPIGKTILSMNSIGWEVTVLQSALNYYGYDLDADGEFGPLTRNALMDFQRKAGIEADGICGPETWRKLFLGE